MFVDGYGLVVDELDWRRQSWYLADLTRIDRIHDRGCGYLTVVDVLSEYEGGYAEVAVILNGHVYTTLVTWMPGLGWSTEPF